tara:strand:- start:2999 stop:3460 length:462 start_codon:yes stop_codon:yes gene_type:complete
MIYVLYGQPGSGKTTLADCLRDHLIKKIVRSAVFSPKLPVIIDGDEFREVFNNKDYSREGRENNIRSANTIATYISKVESKDVILAMVNPYEKIRKELKSNNSDVIEIYLKTNRPVKKEYHVEDFEVGNFDFYLTTNDSREMSWKRLKVLLDL